jgi:hypothetical protein
MRGASNAARSPLPRTAEHEAQALPEIDRARRRLRGDGERADGAGELLGRPASGRDTISTSTPFPETNASTRSTGTLPARKPSSNRVA